MRAFAKPTLGFVVCSFFSLVIMLQATFARQILDTKLDGDVLHSIQKAQEEGEISREKAILQKLYAGFDPEKMEAEFVFNHHQPIKCMTPVLVEYQQIRDELSTQAVMVGDQLLESIGGKQVASEQTYLSPSGNFMLYYTTEGSDAVPDEDLSESGIPDYIEKAAVMADSSYSYQVETVGFDDFLRDEPYTIKFEQLGFYGVTRRTGSTTEIIIHNNFNGFPENNHPEGRVYGSLYVTIAHELKHAIQFANNRWDGDSGRTVWMEMDATLMEEVVHPDVDDYYNYIMSYDRNEEDWNRNSPHSRSIFGASQTATPGSYWHMTWMMFYYEKYGIEFWRDVWDLVRESRLTDESNEISFFDAIDSHLQTLNSGLSGEHLQNHSWHATSGPNRMNNDFGFEDRENYPNPSFRQMIDFSPDSSTISVFSESVNSMGARYYHINPNNVSLGQPSLRLESTTEGANMAMIGFFKDGFVDVLQLSDPLATGGILQSTWDWADLSEIIVVVVNNNRSERANYDLFIESVIPEEDLISNNFPNPFRSQTTINFSVNASKHVKVEIFDVAGRKIQTLADQPFNAGFHNLQFSGNGLASGVYFYRIITNEAVITNKMMLVR